MYNIFTTSSISYAELVVGRTDADTVTPRSPVLVAKAQEGA